MVCFTEPVIISNCIESSIFVSTGTKPKLDIYGIRERIDAVGIIRERVEYNKQKKGIYEITNR